MLLPNKWIAKTSVDRRFTLKFDIGIEPLRRSITWIILWIVFSHYRYIFVPYRNYRWLVNRWVVYILVHFVRAKLLNGLILRPMDFCFDLSGLPESYLLVLFNVLICVLIMPNRIIDGVMIDTGPDRTQQWLFWFILFKSYQKLLCLTQIISFLLFFNTCAYYFLLIGLLNTVVDASFTIRSDYRLQNCLLTLVFQFKVIKARSVTACANWLPWSNSLFCIKSSIFRNVKFISCNAKCRVCLSSLFVLNH